MISLQSKTIINSHKTPDHVENGVDRKIALITGMSGMIAPKIKQELLEKQYEVIAWDRKLVSIDNLDDINSFLEKTQPNIIYHLAYGPETWATAMALYAKNNNIKFIYISTVNVYGDSKGPLTIKSQVVPPMMNIQTINTLVKKR